MTLQKGIQKLNELIVVLQEELDESKKIRLSSNIFQEILDKINQGDQRRLNLLKTLVEIFKTNDDSLIDEQYNYWCEVCHAHTDHLQDRFCKKCHMSREDRDDYNTPDGMIYVGGYLFEH